MSLDLVTMFDFNLDTTEKVVSVVAGFIAIAGAIGIWKKRSGNVALPGAPGNQSSATTTQTVNVSVGTNPSHPPTPAGVSPSPPANIADLKRSTNILFIDDDRGFKIVSVLKKMGWEHTKLVTDVNSLEQQSLLDAHVVFVDIQGVGKVMQYADEGLGLAQAIKRRHPTKRVVIYSAEENGARFHEALREADYCLPKTAEPIRFEDTIVKVLTK